MFLHHNDQYNDKLIYSLFLGHVSADIYYSQAMLVLTFIIP